MRRSRRRDVRKARRLARAFAALEEQAALARPVPRYVFRTQVGANAR